MSKIPINPENLLTLLDTIIMLQLVVENLETLQGTHYNKQQLKQQIKALLKVASPLVERDYNIVFSNGESETQSILFEVEKLVRFISLQKVPQKVILSQMVEAFNLDQKAMESTLHRIINKPKK